MSDELILSAYKAGNADVFPRVLDLHADTGDRIADVTYGNGVFWKQVNEDNYEVVKSDIDPGRSQSGKSIDCRDLPYDNCSFDVIVLDPPYSSGFYRNVGERKHMESLWTPDNIEIPNVGKYHEGVLSVYTTAGKEAHRVLKDGGVLIVKTQDEVSGGKQYLTHNEIINIYEDEYNFYTKDLFVVVRDDGLPSNRWPNRQKHARKYHSYFLIFEKQ